MIRPEELRRGNLINVWSDPNPAKLLMSGPYSVAEIKASSVVAVRGGPNDPHNQNPFFEKHCKDIEPVILTEEWLERFGFEKIFNTFDKSAFETGAFSLGKDDIGFYLTDKPNVVVKYVHQLQNLYFALTGDELTPKTAQP